MEHIDTQQCIDPSWAIARARLTADLEKYDKALGAAQTLVINQADNLREWFRSQRKALRLVAVEVEKTTTPVGKRPRSVYAPLNLFARARSGNLEIYWQLVHKGRTDGALKYVYLRKNQEQGYSIRDLLASAKPFERDLVEQAELRARELRLVWRDLVKARTANRLAIQHCAAASRQAAVVPAAAVPAGPIELVPSMSP